ncbi:polyamine aminopropyltransferase [Nitrogeniibacter mangrovi]|uniref:Polyamine aminopropyltransferase n=1 Tax=Nitrogeniibacter mangrovi TaxID=2016596 RepID=A0A6C1BB69_9RHOO|nr:polyamine aminopropyltransferase [Nitrogeniibacter mangrovi]QID19650.1 polyamine aminopropyltransferase [Nitrogeniibacter mangrovi]
MSEAPKPDDMLIEPLNDQAGHYLVKGRLIEAGDTPYQHYEVWDTPHFGKLFRLDGFFMTSERDEFFYHENLIHVPAIAMDAPRRALVIGGGDGGSVDELFKYPDMEEAVLVELDGKVVDIARAHLACVHNGALDDPRLTLRIEDGLHYVRVVAPEEGKRFDLVVLDLTDPIGPAADLYTEEFFAQCKALMTPQGAISLHLGAPVYQPDRVRELLGRLRRVFAHVRPHFHYIPLYGSLWGMACASDATDPATLDGAAVTRRLSERAIDHLQYYNADTHCAAFMYPTYLRDLIAE